MLGSSSINPGFGSDPSRYVVRPGKGWTDRWPIDRKRKRRREEGGRARRRREEGIEAGTIPWGGEGEEELNRIKCLKFVLVRRDAL